MDWRNKSMAIDLLGAAPSAAAKGVLPFPRNNSMDARLAAVVDKIGFGLFLLASGVLLLRPADSIPALRDVPIYFLIVSACLCLSPARLFRQLGPESQARSMTQLIFGFWLCILLSQLARGSLWDVRTGGLEFFKVFIYYLLIISWVDSPARFRQFLLCLCVCSLAQTIMGLLEYDGWINLSTLRSIEEADHNGVSGVAVIVRRLCGIGIFDDPNDLCLLLVATTALCVGFIGYRKVGVLRFGWFLPLGFTIYTIALTRSRSGLLSLLGSIATLLAARYGRGRALLTGALLFPMMFVIFAGRQTHVDLSNPDDTFQTRLDSWSDSLTLFKSSPVFGVGQNQQVELSGHVAHNSFIQTFAEVGFVGGACFLGAFMMAIRAVRRTHIRGADPEMARLQPIVLAILVGYAVGLLALSRDYEVTTYLILGLAAAYINLTPRFRPLRLNSAFLQRLVVASVLFVASTYVFLRIMRV
jgi:hypothetical protein